jgi:hypothetical protein
MQRRFVLVFAITTIVLASVASAASATAIPGPNGKIAFTSGRPSTGVPAPNAGDKGARIYVADFPSGTPIQVTTLPSGTEMRHRQPNWSPDHTRIAYAAGMFGQANYALWVLDLRTGSQTEIVPAAEGLDRPSWSPDGSQIAYGSKGDLWLTAPTPGSEQIQLTKTATVTEERPVWSPDGKTLYYNRKEAAGTKDLWKKTPVTAGGWTSLVYDDPALDAWQPALSPDGGRLCFLLGPQSSAADLFTIDVKGVGGPAKFAEEGPATGELNCVWSPDGKLILYTRGAFEAGELYTRAPNGSGIDNLTQFNSESHFDGNTDWATNFSPTCDPKGVNVGVNGFASVALSCTDPDSGFGKAPPTPEAIDDSSLEIVTPPKNGNLGSLENGRVIYTPNKDFKGTDSFTYTGSDGVSDADPATVTIQVADPSPPPGGGDATSPVVSAVRVSNKVCLLGDGLAKLSKKTPVGTTISFRVSEAAAATITFQRFVPAKNGKKARFVGAGSLQGLAAKAGLNKVRFQGRLTRTRTLTLGKYRVVVRARDAAGNRSQPRTGPSFTIVDE